MKVFNIVLVLMAAFVVTACNTTRGLGEDVEATGEGIQHAAEQVEEELEDM